MISELDKKILKKIIQSEQPINGTYLSSSCHISVNTLRKEIAIINDYLESYGCYIDTKISIGYNLVIENEQIALPFIHYFLKETTRYEYLNIEDFQKENYIIRRILCSDTTVPIETLMDELYCSKSSILRLIDQTKEYLTHFNLEIKMKRNAGLYMAGSEWNKRMCLINQHKVYRHSYDNQLYKDSRFDAMLLNNTDYEKEIRMIFLSNVPTYPSISFAHQNVPTIFNFIILCKTRHHKADELVFNDELLSIARSSLTYNLTLDIKDSLPDYFKVDFTQKEVDALSIFLCGLRKFRKDEFKKSPEFTYYYTITEDIISYVMKFYALENRLDKTFKEDLGLFLKEMDNIKKFGIYTDDENYFVISKTGLFSSDLCALIAYYLETHHNFSLSLDGLSKLYTIINRSLFENDYFFAPQKVLVISRYSAFFANNIASRLKERFHQMIDYVDVCEYTDIPLVNLNRFDVIVTDIYHNLDSMHMPVIEFSFNRSKFDFLEVDEYFNSLFLKEALKIFKPENYLKKNCQSKKDILSLIYKTIHVNDISEPDWVLDCMKKESYISFERKKEIVLVSNLLYHANTPKYIVIVNSSLFDWDKNNAHIIIYYNYGPGSFKDIQTISYLNKQFVHQDEVYLNNLDEYDYDEVIKNFSNEQYKVK